ncbi:MAG: ABC transporter ATP-binding protein/permease [Chloroflexia bacterium]
MIELTKRFPLLRRPPLFLAHGEGTLAVDRVTFQVAEGEIFGLLGPNGAGKTTLVRMLCTLIEPTSGRASVLGYDLKQDRAIRQIVGLASGEDRSFYWRLSARENLRFFAALHGLRRTSAERRIEELAEALDLGDWLEERFDRLSAGARRRLDVARALLHDPVVLFLDEPTRSLDPAATASVHALLRRLAASGKTLFLVTHRLEEAESLCHRVAILHRGRLRAVAPVSELQRTVSRERRYCLRVACRPEGGSQPWTDWPWHARAVQENEGLWLEVELPADVPLDELLARAHASGLRVIDAALEEASLEEAFERYTREALDGPLPLISVPPVGPASEGRRRPAASAPPSWSALSVRTAAFLRRDLLLQLSYRLATVLQIAGILFSVTAFYFVARLLGGAASPVLSEYGGDYFAFVLIGIAYSAYQSAGLFSFSEAIRGGQMQGTLEAMLLTPTSVGHILFMSALWSFALASLQVLLYLATGAILFGAPVGPVHVGTALLTLLLSILAFSGLGILSAGFILVTKRGDPIGMALTALSTLLSGVYYPVALLPRPLRALASFLPMTHALRAMRLALLQGATPSQVSAELRALALFVLLLFPGGLLAFQEALRRARREGSLGQY